MKGYARLLVIIRTLFSLVVANCVFALKNSVRKFIWSLFSIVVRFVFLDSFYSGFVFFVCWRFFFRFRLSMDKNDRDPFKGAEINVGKIVFVMVSSIDFCKCCEDSTEQAKYSQEWQRSWMTEVLKDSSSWRVLQCPPVDAGLIPNRKSWHVSRFFDGIYPSPWIISVTIHHPVYPIRRWRILAIFWKYHVLILLHVRLLGYWLDFTLRQTDTEK